MAEAKKDEAQAAPKKMPNTAAAMIGVLTAIAIISGTTLGFTDLFTRDRIEANRIERRMSAVREVLPEFVNDPAAEEWNHPELAAHMVFPGRNEHGELVGAAIQTRVGSGYGGNLTVVTGLTPEAEVTAVFVLQHAETPGLGARITEQGFRDQFAGLNLNDRAPAVRQDGGSIDAITAATMSSRAVADAVEKAGQVLPDFLAAVETGGSNE